jgi:uncharacterized membrane protein YgaE (UPF0421/DUF939 family)
MKKILSKISNKVKALIGIIIGVLGVFTFVFIKNKIQIKEKMNYDLSKVKTELEMLNLEKDSSEKKRKLESLKSEEETIKKKIAYIEKIKIEEKRDVTMEELDEFFDSRGF